MPGRTLDEREFHWRSRQEADRAAARRYGERPSWDDDWLTSGPYDEDGDIAYGFDRDERTAWEDRPDREPRRADPYGRRRGHGGGDDYRSRGLPDRGRAFDPRSWSGPAPRFQPMDYTHAGPFYEDDRPARISEPSSWEPGDNRDLEARFRRHDPVRRHLAGEDHHDFEDRARSAGQTIRRVGERVSAWFAGLAEREEEDGPRRYRSDFGREPRWEIGGHRGRGPKGYTRPDERVGDEIHQRLTDDPWLDASHIKVAVTNGEVTLSGAVDNRQARRRAEDIVGDVSGVTHIENDLRIGGNFFTSPGRGYGDSALEAQMRREDAAIGRRS